MSGRMSRVGATKQKYLVAVRVGRKNEIFSFPTKASRGSFIKEIRGSVDGYATTQIPQGVTKRRRK